MRMETSEAMKAAEDLSIDIGKAYELLEELKNRFEDIWASVDVHHLYGPEHEAKFKQCSWDLGSALVTLDTAGALAEEAFDMLDQEEG